MFALIISGVVAKYPYTIGMLRKDNPDTSFPKNPGDELLGQWGMQAVFPVDAPNAGITKNVGEGTPVLVDGIWTQVWDVTDATAEEIAERTVQAATSVRTERDKLLAETDWMALSDVVMSPEMTAYRQALRDISDQVGFPQNVIWPVKPT